ncbi:hypothetical protein CMK11_20465 [Candidatus Poribacteria bacterium]|nr:hypothetical protein [Candidatus Poribacteria bacterium]
MEVHSVFMTSWNKVREREFPGHIIKQMVLHSQDQVLTQRLEGRNLVMELYQDCLGSHLPVHTEALRRLGVARIHLNAVAVE